MMPPLKVVPRIREEMLWREMRFQSFYAIIHLPGML